jgi:hypothetical protein
MSGSAFARGLPAEVAPQIDAALAASQANYEQSAAAGGSCGLVAAREARDIAGARERLAETLATISTTPGLPHVAVSAYGSRSDASVACHFTVETCAA